MDRMELDFGGLKSRVGTSLVAQWIKNPPASAGDTGSIPGQKSRLPHGSKTNKKNALMTVVKTLFSVHGSAS